MLYRLRDIILAATLLLLLLPLMIGIALILWMTQRQVFFCQVRPGWHERPFTLIKFSTLYPAADPANESKDQQQRLTPAGRWLRQYSLDELPQLLNVLRGDMSLVGPRPLLMQYLPRYTPEERRRHDVRPGITGWAQVHGRNTLPFKVRFTYDLWYVDHRSWWLDIKILWMTLRKVWRREGVYADHLTTSPEFDGTN
ncbi:MAG: sugar transferase [Bacteroidia bacterium]|nr:sugar transferase [Bacteroidia bacterium]